ncbi:COG4852 Predicted membrane protein [Rhabdaerophilaceae bacterium]
MTKRNSEYLIAYGAAALVFLAADMVWLGIIAKELYQAQIGHLLAPQFRLGPAIAFYLMYIGGIVYFAIRPALIDRSWRTAILPGALLGFVAYGTYDLTNWAVMRDWPVGVTVADITWGTALTGLASAAGAAAALRSR